MGLLWFSSMWWQLVQRVWKREPGGGNHIPVTLAREPITCIELIPRPSHPTINLQVTARLSDHYYSHYSYSLIPRHSNRVPGNEGTTPCSNPMQSEPCNATNSLQWPKNPKFVLV